MARPKSNPDHVSVFDAVTNRDGLVCFMCGVVHSRAATLQLDYIDHDAADVGSPENLIVACKTCVRRRDKRPLLAYMKTRLTAARAEVEHLRSLPEDYRIMKMLKRPIVVSYAPRITDQTPHAVDGTGSMAADPVKAVDPNATLAAIIAEMEADEDD